MSTLERRLGELFFGPPPRPRPCKHYRVQDFCTGRNRYFSAYAEARTYAQKIANKNGEATQVLTRSHLGRGRCPNVWWAQGEYVEPEGGTR
jgi:hypothetical protein